MRLLLGLNFSSSDTQQQQIVYEPPFGNLDAISFSKAIDYPEDFSITIDNIEGRPLTPATEANVVFIPSTRTQFGYQQTIAFMARAVGIDTEEQSYAVNDITASYDDSLRKLDIDISNFNFSYELDYKKVPTIFSEASIPSEATILEEAKSFLRQMNKFTPSLAQGSQNIIYMNYDSQTDTFTEVTEPTQANVVEIDFFEPDVDEYPVLPPTFHNSQNYVTIVFRDEGNLIIKSQVKTFPKDYDTAGVYPLKSGDEAWAELQNGQGAIVSPSRGSTNIVVREMFLGYYDPEEYHPYLMPVYVFLGDNDFVAYTSAVDSRYIKSDDSSAEE